MAYDNLNPLEYLEWLDNILNKNGNLSDVMLRRFISSAYFCVFNYFASEIFENGNTNCKKENMGSNCMQDFISQRSYRLIDDWNTIYSSRKAVDHYLKNPASWKEGNKKVSMEINSERLKKVIKSSKNLISKIKINS